MSKNQFIFQFEKCVNISEIIEGGNILVPSTLILAESIWHIKEPKPGIVTQSWSFNKLKIQLLIFILGILESTYKFN